MVQQGMNEVDDLILHMSGGDEICLPTVSHFRPSPAPSFHGGTPVEPAMAVVPEKLSPAPSNGSTSAASAAVAPYIPSPTTSVHAGSSAPVAEAARHQSPILLSHDNNYTSDTKSTGAVENNLPREVIPTVEQVQDILAPTSKRSGKGKQTMEVAGNTSRRTRSGAAMAKGRP